jgi:hypothetical protein
VGGFVTDRCGAEPLSGHPHAWVPRPELFAAYEEWCGGRGRGLGRNEFYDAVRDLPGVGLVKDSRGTWVFTGIRLVHAYE